MEQAIEDITRTTEEWGEAFKAKDLSRTVGFVTDHAVLLPPDEPAVIGRTAIKTWSKRLMTEVTIREIDITVERVRVAGDWAVSHGVWHMTMSVGDETVRDSTRYVVIWEQQADGSWKVAHDVWNRVNPPGSGA